MNPMTWCDDRPSIDAFEEAEPARVARAGVRVDVVGVSRSTRGGRQILHGVDLAVEPGEVVALVGASGAGKTTLLETMAGVRPPHEGHVLFDGVDLHANLGAFRAHLGYVPQDDIIHRELSLRATLRHAARLRLDPCVRGAVLDEIVDETLAALDLADRADVTVAALSGGQRKRASIAVELLSRPKVLFLDEPTSGLDPSSARGLMRVLRRLSRAGSTIVLSTHSPSDLPACDRVVLLARDGHLAFTGSPTAALAYFRVETFDEIYERLDLEGTPQRWAARFRATRPPASGPPAGVVPDPVPRRTAVQQWAALTRRSVDTLIHKRLTLAILLGSPVLVVMMLTLLFRPGAFAAESSDPSATVMILFWVAFGSFFFGLTYGLLQICTEYAIVRRERLVGLSLGAYVLSKITVLVPLLAFVDLAMLGVLRAFDRLPDAGSRAFLSLFLTLLLVAAAALALGLLTSAAVASPEQATIALPMLCFPQVLFSGAILAVPSMAGVGRAISFGMADRWAFEGLGKTLDLERRWQEGRSAFGPALREQFGGTFSGTVTTQWIVMGAMTAALLIACWTVLVRRCNQAAT